MFAALALAVAIAGFAVAAPAVASEEAWQRVAITPAEASVLRDWSAQRARATAGAAHGAKVVSALVPTAAGVPAAAHPPMSVAAVAGVPADAAPLAWRRGERLPLDVYRSGKPLPPEVLAQLPEQPRATMLMELDGQVVRVFRPTRTVVDVLR